MYSLFVGLAAPDRLEVVQKRLMDALQASWKGASFNKTEIADLAGGAPGLLDNLAIADRLAPILTWAPKIQGNPRIVKRLLNAVSLRRVLAANRRMNVDFAVLAKLAIFERCTDGPAALALYQLIMEGKDAEKVLLPPEKGKAANLPKDWLPHEDFIERWRAMEPLFADVAMLRPAVFLSRDVMAPARARSTMSDAAREAVQALLRVDSINSPVGKKIIDDLTPADRQAVMSGLIEAMREGDWTTAVPGVHGALQLSNASPEAKTEFSAFVAGLQAEGMEAGIRFLLRRAGLVEAK